MKGTVLIVDDQQEYAKFLNKLLVKFNYQTRVVYNAETARTEIKQFCPDVVLMDKNLPDADGIELVAELKATEPNTQFIVITGHASIKSAVQSAQRGAIDYLTKPCEIEEVLLAVDNAMNKKKLNEEIALLRSANTRSSIPAKLEAKPAFQTTAMKQALELATRAQRQNGPVILTGENGTGKERLARWIHDHSERKHKPFFSISLATLNHNKAEIELFGHEPGAFGNMQTRKKGLLELADSGTLLINDIEYLDIALQAKLLNFLDQKSILRLGGEELVPLDTRIFVSCRASFEILIKEGRFLNDLYYRINVLPILLPPLRNRPKDIIPLTKQILETLATDLGLVHPPALTQDAVSALTEYPWPGNIRELRNILERTIILGKDKQISAADLPLNSQSHDEWHYTIYFPENETLHSVTKKVTKALVDEALRRGQTKQEAAQLLGLSRHALAHQIKSLEL